MKNFAIYEQSKNNRIAVKVGFSWPGFFLSAFWLLFARLWEKAGIAFGVFLVPYGIALGLAADGREGMAEILLSVSSAAVGFVIGKNGNKWRRLNLRARGFNLVAAVEAESSDGALVKLREMSAEELSAAKEKAAGLTEELHRM